MSRRKNAQDKNKIIMDLPRYKIYYPLTIISFVFKENQVAIVMNSFKISRNDFDKLKNVEAFDGIVETIIKFLFALGFVTIKTKESPNEKNQQFVHSYTIAIPNREAFHQMHGLIHSSYLKIYKWNEDAEKFIDNALKNLLEFCQHGGGCLLKL